MQLNIIDRFLVGFFGGGGCARSVDYHLELRHAIILFLSRSSFPTRTRAK